MPNDTKICLTIAGVDPSGGAGVYADIRAFQRFGCFPTAAITSITSQNTQGVFGAEHQTADSLRAQILPILDDYQISALKTGMIPTAETIEETARIISEYKLPNLVVDPVVRSTSGFDLISDDALKILIEMLFPLSAIITPNLAEAERITKMQITNSAETAKAGSLMQNMGAGAVLIKGGHHNANSDTRFAVDFLFIGDETYEFSSEYIDTTATHGTGCILSAAIAANLALGRSLKDAVRIAKEFVHAGINNAPNIGKGNSPIGI